MGRRKGGTNKAKLESGNPAFNIANVEPSKTLGVEIAPGAIMPEDLELERSLQAMVQSMPVIDDVDPTIGVVKIASVQHDMLSEAVDDYTPATTYAELQEQCALAKAHGCDAIEASLDACRRICRDPQLETVGYFTYHGIHVYLIGAYEKSKARDKQSIEQKLFGKSNDIERQKEIKNRIKLLEEQLND